MATGRTQCLPGRGSDTQLIDNSKRTQDIDTSSMPSAGLVGQRVQLNVSGGASGEPVVYTSSTPRRCTVTSSGLVTYKRQGNCNIELGQAGNANYHPTTERYIIRVFGFGF